MRYGGLNIMQSQEIQHDYKTRQILRTKHWYSLPNERRERYEWRLALTLIGLVTLITLVYHAFNP